MALGNVSLASKAGLILVFEDHSKEARAILGCLPPSVSHIKLHLNKRSILCSSLEKSIGRKFTNLGGRRRELDRI